MVSPLVQDLSRALAPTKASFSVLISALGLDAMPCLVPSDGRVDRGSSAGYQTLHLPAETRP